MQPAVDFTISDTPVLPCSSPKVFTPRSYQKDIQSEIHRQTDLVSQLEKYKLLFCGSGKPLEHQIRQVFEELGILIIEAEPNRDDLIMTYGDRVVLVEIKGVSKSATEKHATQLEKWVSEYFLSHEIEPKGILVVNAYKDVPLTNRNDAPFLNPMVVYSERREHCLMTGLQLLGLYLDCRGDSEKTPKMVDAIFKTDGIFAEYQNWADILSHR